MPRWPGFIFGSNSVQAFSQNQERTVNLYVERAQSRGDENPEGSLLGTPGFRAWSSGSAMVDIGTRALAVAAGRLFGVVGGGFYEWNGTGVVTRHGSVAQDSNPAQLVYNGTVGGQLGIASGGSIYSFALATNTLTGPHFGGATTTMLNFADGFGLAFAQGTGRVYLSALNDFTSWSLGTFFQRSKFPDPWQTMFVDANGLIWMIGAETFEVWYNTGSGTQPWAVLSGLYGKYGIAAPFAFSVSTLGQYWLARSPDGGLVPVSTRGSTPQPISNYAVEKAFQDYRRSGEVSNAELFTYHDQGHTSVNVSFPGQNRTWSHDVQGQSWAERGKWNSARGDYDVWAPRVHADCFRKHLVGDRSTGTIWEMDTTIATDVDGNGIRRLRRAPVMSAEGRRIPIDNIQLVMDVGLGLSSGQGSDPQAMYRFSPNGGRTWGNERMVSIGQIGDWGCRVNLNRFGAADFPVLEVSWSDPVPIRVTNAFFNNLEGPRAERAA